MRSKEIDRVDHFFLKLLSRREAQPKLELRGAGLRKGGGNSGRTAGRDPEGTRPWAGGWKRRVGLIQILLGKSRDSQGQLITQCRVTSP